MAVKCVQLTVSIRGLDTDGDMLDFLVGWVRAATKAALLGNQKDRFRFRNESESDIDIEVKIIEQTGEQGSDRELA